MERRGSDRIQRRVPCSFDYEGARHEALVLDLSAGGLFLQTDVGIALGSELVLQLHGDGGAGIELRGRVVRRRITPAVIASLLRRGVGIQLLAAPETYRDWLCAEPAPDAAWSALQDEIPPFERLDGPPASLDLQLMDEAPTAVAEPPEVPALAAEAPPEASVPAEPAPCPAPARCSADALLLHQGELEDVRRVLEALGAVSVSQGSVDAASLADWEQPPRLIVANGRQALRLTLGPNIEGQSIIAVAVVDSESQTLCSMLRRQGFRYVVRRPVHPDALRLLLGRALFRGRERRDAARVSVGCEVALRFGLRRKPATLLELSRTGGRLLIPDWIEPGGRLTVRIPSTVTGNRPLLLVGRVVRSERQRRPGGEAAVAVALRFDRLDGPTRLRLEALVTAHTLGPRPLARPAATSAAAGERSDPAIEDRRQGRRVPYRQELVALEPSLERVRHTLIGIDLSPGGVRVEPHPDLAVGDKVRLAIYDTASNGTLVLDAEAIRDQGVRGVALRFQTLSAEARAQIERIIEAAPQIESAGTPPGGGVVVAEMLPRQPA